MRHLIFFSQTHALPPLLSLFLAIAHHRSVSLVANPTSLFTEKHRSHGGTLHLPSPKKILPSSVKPPSQSPKCSFLPTNHSDIPLADKPKKKNRFLSFPMSRSDPPPSNHFMPKKNFTLILQLPPFIPWSKRSCPTSQNTIQTLYMFLPQLIHLPLCCCGLFVLNP